MTLYRYEFISNTTENFYYLSSIDINSLDKLLKKIPDNKYYIKCIIRDFTTKEVIKEVDLNEKK